MTEIVTREGTFTADVDGSDRGTFVILLHGFPQTRHTWRHVLIDLAAAGCCAVAVDQRGYSPGVRPPGVEAYKTNRLVADVLDIADALGATRFHLVGHDWGGHVAWLTAAHHADRIHSLTVLSRPHPAAFDQSFALDPEQAARSQHHNNMGPEMTDRWHADDSALLRAVLTHAGVAEPDADAYLSVLGSHAALDAAMNWYRAAVAGGYPAAAGGGMRIADTPAVSVPVTYIWGTEDNSVGRRAAELTVEHVSGPYRFVAVEGAGHFLTDDLGAATTRAAILNQVTDRSP